MTARSRLRSPSASGPPPGIPPSPTSGAWPAPTISVPACCRSTSATPAFLPRSIRLRRLAAASGSTLTALTRTLTGLTPASEAHRLPPSPAESQAARKARLFGIIRDDAARGISIRQIADRRHVHRRMVRQALAEPAGPPPRKQATRPARAIDPVRDILDELASDPRTIWEIWTTVTDEHDSDASYAAIRDYIRAPAALPDSPDCLQVRSRPEGHRWHEQPTPPSWSVDQRRVRARRLTARPTRRSSRT